MEKLIYPLWKPSAIDADTFRDTLLEDIAPAIIASGTVLGLGIAVADSAVQKADNKRMSSGGDLPTAVLCAWVNTVGNRLVLERELSRSAATYTGYLVTESEPLRNTLHRPSSGMRTHGMCQVVFLQQPSRLSREQWLDIWQGSHTDIAIETQSTFGYRQNVIVRQIAGDERNVSAMIEENFPPEAMSSDYCFYGVDTDDKTGLAANMTAMMDSCTRFIDFDKIDVIPMSEYILLSLPGTS